MKVSEMTFPQLLTAMKRPPYKGTLICFDPGETTGLAVFVDGEPVHKDQLLTKDLTASAETVSGVFSRWKGWPGRWSPETASPAGDVMVVMEDYRIYGWKTEQHTWAGLHTPKFIGAIIAMCWVYEIPFHLQMAQQAKGFCTDDKLKMWGYYDRSMKHARDAIRHGCYYLAFGKAGEEE